MRGEARVIEGASIEVVMRETGRRARGSARALALAAPATKTAALKMVAAEIRRRSAEILKANAEDYAEAIAAGLTPSFLDRMRLDAGRVEAIAKGVEEIADLPDPVGRVLASWERPNGLKFERVSTPLGVIGIIYESRPNVTADAGALAIKSGNAAILRGGSDSFRSSQAIVAAIREALHETGLPEDAIQLVPTRDRAAVGLMLAGLEGRIDVIVPRGGKSLVARVQAEARVPVFAHLEGINHVFVERTADLDMAKKIVLNAKMRRVSVCGALETLLVDRACAQTHLVPLVEMLKDAGCEVRGDAATRMVFPTIVAATEADWSTEYLEAIISVKVVADLDEAIAHIEAFGSHHTDAIVTEDARAAERFLNEVDSAIVLWNASTQFADGGEFGFGGEIGISTGRMHARGPVGAEQLCSFKYRVTGTGQTRP